MIDLYSGSFVGMKFVPVQIIPLEMISLKKQITV